MKIKILLNLMITLVTTSFFSGQTKDVLKNEITYLFFEIERNNQQPPSLTLKETKHVEGKLKTSVSEFKPEYLTGDLKVELIDSRGEIVNTIKVNNPLDEVMEAYETTGPRRFVLSKDKGEFFVRSVRDQNIQSLRVLRKVEEGFQVIFTQNVK